MSEIMFLLYLGDVANNLGVVLLLFGMAFGIATLAAFINEDAFTSRARKLSIIASVFVLSAALIPSKHVLYIAAGGAVAAKSLDTELGKKVYALIENKLDEALSEKKK